MNPAPRTVPPTHPTWTDRGVHADIKSMRAFTRWRVALRRPRPQPAPRKAAA